MIDSVPTCCSNCGGDELRWHADKQGPSHIADGRLRMSEIHVIAYLACEECSETLRVIQEHEVEEIMNRKL